MRSRSWVVQAPCTLAGVLEAMGSAGAVQQGRVFVDGRRVLADTGELVAGSIVEVFEARPPLEPARALDRREGLVVAFKPAAMPTEPDRRGSGDSLVRVIARDLALDARRVHAVSRLDVGVSGLVLLAITEGAQRHAAELQQAGKLERHYLAIAAGCPTPPSGEWRGEVRVGSRALPAISRYRVIESLPSPRLQLLDAGGGTPSLLHLTPLTGRTHQLRQHARAAGAALLGDRRYGGPSRLRDEGGGVLPLARICLHAFRVVLADQRGAAWTVEAGSELLASVWADLGGTPAMLPA
ncbi:MAG TPA: pseudouridine synthase [Polyangiaceae bacterium]|nr:pseudouridine synthase [Polyangiaceae bacterium]